MAQSLIGHLEAELAGLKEAGLFKRERVITSKQAGTVKLADGSSVINLCANNYLGLAHNAEVTQAAHDRITAYIEAGVQEGAKLLVDGRGRLSVPRRRSVPLLLP